MNENDSHYGNDPYHPAEEPPLYKEKKHTGIGIASFIIAMIIWIGGVNLLVSTIPQMAELAEAIDPTIVDQEVIEQEILEFYEANPMISLSLLLLMALGGLTFLGLILGIIGCFAKNRKKLFAVLGTIFNALPIATFIFFLLIGFAIM